MSSGRYALANLCAARLARRQQLVRLRQLHSAVFKGLRFRRLVVQQSSAPALLIQALRRNRALIDRLRRPSATQQNDRFAVARAKLTTALNTTVRTVQRATCAPVESVFEVDFSAQNHVDEPWPAIGLLADFDIDVVPRRPGAPHFAPALINYLQINAGARAAPEIRLS